MPKGTKVTPIEAAAILDLSAELKARNEAITSREIGEIVERSHQVTLKVMSDKRFNDYKTKYKKKIDIMNAKTMDLASESLQKEVKEGKIKAYQLIGLLKVLSEITYPNTTPIFGGDNASINVQVVRGGVTYNKEVKNDDDSNS